MNNITKNIVKIKYVKLKIYNTDKNIIQLMENSCKRELSEKGKIGYGKYICYTHFCLPLATNA